MGLGTRNHSFSLLVGLLLLGCSGEELIITSPQNGSMVPSRVTVEGEVHRDGIEVVTVNGTEARVNEGRFRAQVILPPGPQLIKVVAADDLSAQLRVDVDPAPPVITIESPEESAFIFSGVDAEEVEIRGHVEEDHLVELTVEGNPVRVRRNGDFQTTVTLAHGAHRVRLRAMDEAGQESYAHISALVGQFARPGGMTPDAVTLHLGPAAYLKISRDIQDMLRAVDWSELVRMYNPAMDEFWGTVDLTAATFSELRFRLVPADGGIKMIVDVIDFKVDFEVDAIGFDPRDGFLFSPHATLEAMVNLSPRAGGDVDVHVRAREIELREFTYEVEDLPGFIEDSDSIREAIEEKTADVIVATARTALPTYLEGLIADIPRNYSFAPAEAPIRFIIEPQYISNGNNSLLIGTEASIYAEEPLPQFIGAPGYLLTRRVYPAPPVAAEDAAVIASLDMLNAAIYALWAGGTMSVELPVPDALRLLIGLDEVLPRGTPATIMVDTRLPPVIETDELGQPQIAVVDVRLAIMAEGREVVVISLGARGQLAPKLVGIEFIPEIRNFSVRADVLLAPDNFDKKGQELDEFMHPLVEYIIPDLVDISSFPFPTLYSFEIRASTAQVQDGYLVMTGNLFETVE